MRMDIGLGIEILRLGFALFTAICVADDDSGLCKSMFCGKGTCNLTSSFGGLVETPQCDCEPGWKKPISLPFLPCVIPNCTFDVSCSKKAPSSAPSPEPSSANSTGLLHPCTFAFALCGEGSCQKTSRSNYSYSCNCEAGYENLLNMTAGPCIRECSIGADCSNLGLNVGGNTSASPPPAQADTSGSISSKNKGVGRSFPWQMVMEALSLCVLLLYR